MRTEEAPIGEVTCRYWVGGDRAMAAVKTKMAVTNLLCCASGVLLDASTMLLALVKLLIVQEVGRLRDRVSGQGRTQPITGKLKGTPGKSPKGVSAGTPRPQPARLLTCGPGHSQREREVGSSGPWRGTQVSAGPPPGSSFSPTTVVSPRPHSIGRVQPRLHP